MDAFLRDYAETRRFMAGRPARAKLTPDGQAVLFRGSGPRSDVQALFEAALRTGRTRRVLDPEELGADAAQPLPSEERAQLERQRVAARGFTRFELSGDGQRVVLPFSGELLLLERATGAARTLRAGRGPLDPRFSPGGAALAYVREQDLRVLDLASNVERRITEGGGADVT